MIRYLNPDHDLTGYTVLLPSLGVGNVAQLVMDMLVAALKMEKVAIVWHPAIVPIIGPNAFDQDSEDPTTSCELFICRITKLAVVQLRAPIVPSQVNAFFSEMMSEFASQHIQRLLVLTSSYAYEKHVVDSSPIEYLANDLFDGSVKYLSDELGWAHFSGNNIFGGGFAKRVFDLATEHNIPAVLLFKYVSEGDNTWDALELCQRLNDFLQNVLPKDESGNIRLVRPASWNLLYGNSAPEQLY